MNKEQDQIYTTDSIALLIEEGHSEEEARKIIARVASALGAQCKLVRENGKLYATRWDAKILVEE